MIAHLRHVELPVDPIEIEIAAAAAANAAPFASLPRELDVLASRGFRGTLVFMPDPAEAGRAHYTVVLSKEDERGVSRITLHGGGGSPHDAIREALAAGRRLIPTAGDLVVLPEAAE